ncbi:hypothetical protein ACN9MJ_00460 [Acidovorax facilis]|jgi:hypothetical protein|uniref:hypothetical protein n=1 Tax=Acidovorax TaxID=12916 RepID=UPI0011C42A03|nr:hypothetical protein [Acidovorax sp. 93]
MFAEYENYLNEVKEFDNYWSDVGISEAVSMLEKFSANDWQMLNEKIQDKSKVWLVSCAETLGDDVGGGSSFDLLLKLLSSEINEVKIAALDSINSRISLGFDIGDSGGKIRSAVSTARGSAGVVVSRMLDSLEKKLT